MIPRKLKPDQVRNARHKYAAGYNCSELAELFGVHFNTMKRILLGQTYKEIAGPTVERLRDAHGNEVAD